MLPLIPQLWLKSGLAERRIACVWNGGTPPEFLGNSSVREGEGFVPLLNPHGHFQV
jgi:hypothetical protein